MTQCRPENRTYHLRPRRRVDALRVKSQTQVITPLVITREHPTNYKIQYLVMSVLFLLNTDINFLEQLCLYQIVWMYLLLVHTL